MIFTKAKALLAYSFLSLAGATTSFASEEDYRHFNVDGLVGVDFLSGGRSGSTTNLGFGGRFGYFPHYNWEVGVGFTTTANSTTVGNYTNSYGLGLLMADVNYHFSGDWNPLYLGLRLGTGINSSSTNDPSASGPPTTANFAWGLVGGYDIGLGKGFTIGPRISYTMVTLSGTTNQSDFQLHGALKYWF